MRNLILLLCTIFCIFTANAEDFIENNTDITGNIDVSYENLSGQYLRFNCLRDRGAEFVDFELFNGRAELNADNYCDRDIHADAMRSIRSMLPGTQSWNAENILAIQDESGNEKNAVMSILLYQYLYIKENALKDNLIRFEDGKVYDNFIDGVHQDPYNIDYILTFAPQDSVFDNNLTFSFPSTTYKSNFGGTFDFDAGDGLGYRTFKIGDKISINYTSGEHILKLRIRTNGKSDLVAHCKIKTADFATEAVSRSGDSYHDLFSYQIISTVHEGKTVVGKLSRIRNHNGLQPFIYVEGFDLPIFGNSGLKDNPDGYGTQGPMTLLWNGNVSRDIFNYYDFYYLDFVDGTMSNKAKAALLQDVLQTINSQKTDQTQNIIFGSSMGGITARYCLSKMEQNGIKHQTSVLICQDTPNLGANVPLGALYAAQELLRLYNRHSSSLKDKVIRDKIGLIKQIIDSDAAKEILYNYVTPSGVLDNSIHNDFMCELKELGYPHGDNGLLRCVAICNGNEQISFPNEPLLSVNANLTAKMYGDMILNTFSSFFGFGMYLLTHDFCTSLLAIVPGNSKLTFTGNIYPTGSSHPVCDMRIKYIKKVLWLAKVSTTLYKYSKSAPSGTVNYDIVNGSYYDLTLNQLNNQFSISSGLPLIVSWGVNLKFANRFLFIPTASSLDIGGGITTLTQTDYTSEYSMSNRPLKPKHSPFHSYYISSFSEQHIHFSSSMNQWLREQLSTFVEGDKIGATGTKYTLRNNAKNRPISWSVSDESIATISNTGVLTVKKHGFVTILATLDTGEAYPKRIMAGLPQYIIRSTHQPKYALLTPIIHNRTNDYANFETDIKFEVGSGSPIKWEEMTEYSYTVNFNETGNQKIYYFRPVYISNDTKVYGASSYITINTAFPYIIEPTYITFHDGAAQNTITIKQNPYYIGSIPDEFKIYYLENKGSSTITGLKGVTSLVLSSAHIFPQSILDSFKNSTNQSITEDFAIRNKNGDVIERFKVSIIKQ